MYFIICIYILSKPLILSVFSTQQGGFAGSTCRMPCIRQSTGHPLVRGRSPSPRPPPPPAPVALRSHAPRGRNNNNNDNNKNPTPF